MYGRWHMRRNLPTIECSHSLEILGFLPLPALYIHSCESDQMYTIIILHVFPWKLNNEGEHTIMEEGSKMS